jgi:DNA-binding NarL/FixJ family response regulator
LLKNILIVDDNPVIRKTLRQVLEAETDWRCGEAVNGKDAIEKAQQLHPNLVVLDLSMPVMNGLQASRELKRLYPYLPLVMFTSFETAHLKREAVEAGVSSILSKSESIHHLISTIQGLLEPAN